MPIGPVHTYPSVETLAQVLDSMLADESEVVILTDSHVSEACLPLLLNHSIAATRAEIIELEPGEESKCPEIAVHIWSHLLELKASRKCVLINLGGGVITDLGGFIAATYKRGIRHIHIPTSLMGMTDAAIGGKTGIDLNHVKNAVGTFSHPEAVLISPDWLSTLAESEWRSGFAEMLKHALTGDSELWNDLLAVGIGESISEEILERSVRIKKEICTTDPRETGPRKLLNFGHTFGHAVESVMLSRNTPRTHGSCVITGMIAECILSKELGLLAEHECLTLRDQLSLRYPESITGLPAFEELAPFLWHDKKNTSHHTLNFTLLKTTGHAIWDQPVSRQQAAGAWNTLLIG
jgi:3-dehydroquinate synthase